MDQKKLTNFLREENFKEALLILNEELNTNPNNEIPLYQRGLVYAQIDQADQALSDFNKALEINPKNAQIISERGVLYFNLKNYPLALTDLNNALLIEPNNPYRYSSRAFVKSSMGDLQGAIDDYEVAVRLDPEDLVAHNNLGIVYEKLGYKQKSKKSFEKADQKELFDNKESATSTKTLENPPVAQLEYQPMVETIATSPLSNYLITLKNVLFSKKEFLSFFAFVKNKLK